MVEVVFGISFVILMVLILFQSLALPFVMSTGTIAPGFFPRITTIIVLVLTLIYLVTVILKRKQSPIVESAVDSDGEHAKPKNTVWLQVFIIGALCLSLLVVKYLGMLLTLGIFTLVTLVIVEKISWIRSFIYSAVIILGLYLVFDVWIGMRLPYGIFG